MSSKKQIVNGYSLFVYEYIASEKKKGRNITTAAAYQEAGPMWKAQPKSVQEEWKRKAKGVKKDTPKCTNDGRPIETVQLELRKEIEKEAIENKEIKGLVNVSASRDLENTPFYVMHTNYYCVTQDGTYYHCEMALLGFTVKQGIFTVMHRLLDPGQLPLGYRWEAQTLSDETHNLPMPPYLERSDNMENLLDEILKIIREGTNCGVLPPIFVPVGNEEAAKNLIERAYRARETAYDYMENDDYENIRVFPMDKLFMQLKNALIDPDNDIEDIAPSGGFPVLSAATYELEKTLNFDSKLSCEEHIKTIDHEHFCSQNIIYRKTFIILDHCCQAANVPMIPGKHCPTSIDKRCLDPNFATSASQKDEDEWVEVRSSKSRRSDSEDVGNEAVGRSFGPSFGFGRGQRH